jgi:SAM-dependent methyltransferase
MLGAFAELVQAAGGGPVADAGCGPGHVTAHLHSLGLPAFGVELSPGTVEVARRDHPGLRFDVGRMTALEQADGEPGGVVASSIIRTPPEVLPTVFEEFHRVLPPEATRCSASTSATNDGARRRGTAATPWPSTYLLPPDRVAELATRAGLVVHATLVRELESGQAPQARLLVRKPRNS